MRTLAATLDAAAVAFAAGRLDEAAAIYRRAERRAPADFRATYSLAVIDLHRGHLQEARRRLQDVVVREPGLFMAWHNLGAASRQLGDWTAAAEAYGRAAALRPDSLDTLDGLATALAALGRIDEAVAQHRFLAATPAARWRALTRIALLRPDAIADAELAEMREAAAEPRLDPDTRTGLLFAVGDLLDARGRPDDAFAAFAAGNRLKHEALGPAVAQAAEANAAAAAYVTRRFDAAALAGVGRGHASTAPIFVLGFPRSGSTLIEQILASHPGVQGLGETGVWPALAAEAPEGRFRDLAERYLTAMRARGWDGASRFVDKTLENYLHVGAIRLAFPNAVILHSVRDPIDTGFACWRQLFAAGNETLYDLADIAAEYRRYRGLMDHWAAVAPGAVTDVSYEALVADPEPEMVALVTKAAGLPWDPACLRFFEREGAVGTASAVQVRRPIYASSVARWRRHVAELRPLIDGLKV